MASMMSQGGGISMQMPSNMNMVGINQMGSKVSNQISKTDESLSSPTNSHPQPTINAS
eukprot:CAMPEP_0204631874 /NCGR_PEP_ID=MMETSP0717-20131115/23665_1 /ASSEMBLY_ACC=CAM_ASM_000666 /TAXON_ID=230516 /ORGANISM="Chaetoceros curvisetus" /LENGTH=57 /DNA_ID=CAMNT_0051649563 /DNA_START=382 /DNA_END=552 /DNA_ORIENTATION=+